MIREEILIANCVAKVAYGKRREAELNADKHRRRGKQLFSYRRPVCGSRHLSKSRNRRVQG